MILVPATVHGRVLIEPDVGAAVSSRALVGVHGYAQTAGDMMQELNRIPGAAGWTRVSIQALNTFYIRGNAQVVANWMTREDREQSIADNIAYVDTAMTHVGRGVSRAVYAGFSQGVAMAYRAALLGAQPAAGIIALAGDIPPEVKTDAPTRHPWPKVLIGVGNTEQWYSGAKLDEDLAFLSKRGIEHSVVRFEGGHEWTEEFRTAAGEFLTTM